MVMSKSLRFGALLAFTNTVSGLAPLLSDGSEVDWWFVYKFNTASFPECSTTRECIFGGDVQNYTYGFGMQYLLSSGVGGQVKSATLHTDCIGTGSDPVANTFNQIYSGEAPNYVIWNDQFYEDPHIDLDPPCINYCGKPWGHSKGFMAWDANGEGFVVQSTTPDWPGNGDKTKSRAEGNTLGCVLDDDVEVAQHLFAVKLTASDTAAVLRGLAAASVVTDPSNEQIVKMTDSPADIASLVNSLGQLDNTVEVFDVTLSTKTADGTNIRLLAKNHDMWVSPWHMVSAVVGEPLRVASWWTYPKIDSTEDGMLPGCWSDSIPPPLEVQAATSGQWQGTTFSLEGGSGINYNHAKVAHSLTSSNLVVFGDMNMQGVLNPTKNGFCNSSQSGRGGLFFVLSDASLHRDLTDLLTGDTAPYWHATTTHPPTPPSPAGDCGGAGVSSTTCRNGMPSYCVYIYAADEEHCSVAQYGCYERDTLPDWCPEKTTPTSPPSPPPSPPSPSGSCGGAGVSASTCRGSSTPSGCVYIYSADEESCNVAQWGCYEQDTLPDGCPEKTSSTLSVVV